MTNRTAVWRRERSGGSRLVDRIHRVGEAPAVGGLVTDAEQLELVGRFLLGQAHRPCRLLVANLPQRAQFVCRHQRIPRRSQALTPGRPGASPTGGAERDSGVNVDAIEISATRPLSVSK